MVMLLAGESSIREIIPFPMNKNAQDDMMGAPSTVEQKQLDELHIAITALGRRNKPRSSPFLCCFCSTPSVLRSKTLPQAEFTSAEEI